MTNRRKPNAKAWRERNIEDWNTTTFHAYLADKHKELFGIDYVPFKGWNAEKGMIGDIIGTRTGKPRKGSNEALKRFIDLTFADYKPTPQYPGTSFGFMWTYRKNVWQRIQAESMRRQAAEAKREQQAQDWDELADWL